MEDPHGAALHLLSRGVALTSTDPHQKWKLTLDQNGYLASFDRSGTYPIEVHFNAAVTKSNDWSAVNFRVATSALQPVVLQGLAADTQFQFANAARPERTGTNFVSYLPVDGTVSFAWKQARPEAEGKLFYAAEMLARRSASVPDLMRQAALLNGKIMQGEMSQLTLQTPRRGRSHAGARRRRAGLERGAGDQFGSIANWSCNSTSRRRTRSPCSVQMQTPLGAFPQTADAMQLQPENATRFAGYSASSTTARCGWKCCRPAASRKFRRTNFPEAQPVSRHRAASGLPTAFPARILRCASRRTRFCRKSACRRCWPIISAKANWRWMRKSSWTSAKRRCANCC